MRKYERREMTQKEFSLETLDFASPPLGHISPLFALKLLDMWGSSGKKETLLSLKSDIA